MRGPFLVGKRIYLRTLDENDIGEEYIGWLNDNEVTRYLVTGAFPATPGSLRTYLERFHDSQTDIAFAIVHRESNQHIGNVTINYIDWVNRTASGIGLIIGNKDFWGQGYAFEAWTMALEYAFHRLGLRRINEGVVASNHAALKVLKRLGFKVEGNRRQAVLVDGVFQDIVVLGMLHDEFYKYAEDSTKN